MKKIIIILLFFSLCMHAQESIDFETVKTEYLSSTTDSARFMKLYLLSTSYVENDPDSAMHYAQRLVRFVAENKDSLPSWTEWNSSMILGMALWSSGNYPDAQEYYFKQLEQSEAIKDTFGIFMAYKSLGELNRNEGNYRAAINYYKKCLSFYHDEDVVWWQVNYIKMSADLAKAYEQADVLDSALNFARESLQHAMKTYGKAANYYSGNIMGAIYSKLGQPALALEHFRSFINGVKDDPARTKEKSLCLYEIARHFERTGKTDSAVFYAQKAFHIDQKHSFKINILNTSNLLSELYQSSGKIDSAYKYLNIMLETREDMFSKEKISRMQTLEFNEQVRQKEIEITKQLQEQDRKHNLQLILIAISIITFIILFLLLSRSIIVTHKVVMFLDVVVLLVVFEFINLLLHPFLEKITHHSPVLMLLALVSIAALLVPIHHKLEKWAGDLLVEKNKKIRLAAAKKTIDQLEGRPDISDKQEPAL